MNKLKDISPETLLTTFFRICERQLSFLEENHNFRHISGLSEYRGGRQIITQYNGQPVPEQFWAVVRYEKKNHALELVYGDSDYVLQGYFYDNHIHRFSFTELLLAAKRPCEAIGGNWWITRPEIVEGTIIGMASSLKSNLEYFVRPSPRLIERALAMRSTRVEQCIREQYKRDVEKASQRAAKAFMDKDFRKVIEIYAPYEKDLAPADAKKLTLARRVMTGQ